MIHGWLGYFDRYCHSALYGMCRHVNKAFVRGARRKFKTLRRLQIQAVNFLEIFFW